MLKEVEDNIDFSLLANWSPQKKLEHITTYEISTKWLQKKSSIE